MGWGGGNGDAAGVCAASVGEDAIGEEGPRAPEPDADGNASTTAAVPVPEAETAAAGSKPLSGASCPSLARPSTVDGHAGNAETEASSDQVDPCAATAAGGLAAAEGEGPPGASQDASGSKPLSEASLPFYTGSPW